ncbi:PQQ-dependent sugar dehydrogenase [Flexithrix dorotheae]|uniref:PQQ-dependent sugar dehydrogenase n=1 Tax=Flexithrix dorotheae TaxID=70993 RepID=UPI0003772B58|nr:PQQ-dependent sugar dehydrogenase [Flexithrix dorotheae]
MKILLLKKIFFVLLVFFSTTCFGQQLLENFFTFPLVDGLSSPTSMVFTPDNRILIGEQKGTVRVIKNGILQKEPFIELDANLVPFEQGLESITLDPNFEKNSFVYLFYTLPKGVNNRLIKVKAVNDTADVSTIENLLDFTPLGPSTIHNGGGMRFGLDGKLYIAHGENGHGPSSQYWNHHGKVIRINSDGSIPEDNPYNNHSNENLKYIWSWGLRNPYTMDIHPKTGRIFVNDVGEESWEEINDITEPDQNFGWPIFEGNGNDDKYKNPLYAYPHESEESSTKGCAISGGTFFLGESSNYPSDYKDKYYFMDYCNRWIKLLDLADSSVSTFAENIGGSNVSLTTGSDGNLYFLERSAGKLHKIIYTEEKKPQVLRNPDSFQTSEKENFSLRVYVSGKEPISYQWKKDGVILPGETSSDLIIASASFSDAGKYSVVISNEWGEIESKKSSISVVGFNARPTAKIMIPRMDTLYTAGDTIYFSGKGIDLEDGEMADSTFSWSVVFHHEDHTHDGPPIATGSKEGSFVIPTVGEVDSDVWYRLYLKVEDSGGLTDRVYKEYFPNISTITLNTKPVNLWLSLDGHKELKSPITFDGVSGVIRELGSFSPQIVDSIAYIFDHWEHGGEIIQEITTPPTAQTFTAVFKEMPNEIEIYPNPVTDKLIFDFNSTTFKTLVFSLISISGKEIVNETKLIPAGISDFFIDVSKIPSGLYILQLKNKDINMIQKIVIE